MSSDTVVNQIVQADKLLQLEQALQKEKELNQLKSHFISMVAHEFRSPLSTILSSADLIETYLGQGEPDNCLRHIQRIYTSVNNMAHLLQDLMILEKLESGNIQLQRVALDLNRFMGQIIEKITADTKETQTIQHRHSGPANITVDNKLLRGILVNLLFYLRQMIGKSSGIELISEQKNDCLYIQLKTSGIKQLNENIQQQLSDVTHMVKGESFTDSNLSLSVVRRYLDLLNGSMEMSREKGRTSTINLSIPLS